MKINELHMTARHGYAHVHWTGENGDKYGFSLEQEGGQPVRPFRVKLLKPIGRKEAKRYFNRRTAEQEERRSSQLDSESKAHAPMIAEVLRRAEAEGMYEAALKREEEREARREAEENAKELAAIHEVLDRLIKSEDQAVSQRSLMLKHAGDEALRVIVRALRR